jgi:hypothetical protein
MEPLDEHELGQLLSQWKAPPTPQGLRLPELQPPPTWWRWLFSGTIRVPVPVGIAIVLLVLWVYSNLATRSPVVRQPEPASLADFQPVGQLEPIIERKQQ